MPRTVFRGADLLLPDRRATRQALVIDADRIAMIVDDGAFVPDVDRTIDLTGRLVAPGFIDTHVHGAAGHDVLDGPGAVAAVAAALPRWGVTSWCPTSMACAPSRLEPFLVEVALLRDAVVGVETAADSDGVAATFSAACVVGAHLESNFLNPAYAGAQPIDHLRALRDAARPQAEDGAASYAAADILDLVARYESAIAIVTLAPELPGALDLVRRLAARGVLVSIGHSGATFEEAQRAFDAGARRATHLFNRMTPMTARAPGVAGAALARADVTAELIVDGWHVHPAVMRTAIAAKGARRIAAITDGTAGAGLARGAFATLGGRRVRVEDVARLEDGTMAGSVVTMDRGLRVLVDTVGLDLTDAMAVCARTPALDLGLPDRGILEAGARADLVVLRSDLSVQETWIGGRCVYRQ